MWLLELWEELTGVCLRGSNYLLIDNRGLQNKIVTTKLPTGMRLLDAWRDCAKGFVEESAR
jgi:hypothetical protein